MPDKPAPTRPYSLGRTLAIGAIAATCIGTVTAVVVVRALDTDPAAPGCKTPHDSKVAAPAPAPAPAPEPTPVAPAPIAPACESYDFEEPPTKWTIGPDHFGPFTPCATVDRAFVARVFPGFTVETEQHPYVEDHQDFVVKRGGKRYVTISPAMPDGGPPLSVTIHTRELETPWRVRVGDNIKTLRSRHRDMLCMYGAADGHEGLWCRRNSMGDGWVDTFQYTIDMRPLGSSRAMFDVENDSYMDKIGHLRVTAIRWEPLPPR